MPMEAGSISTALSDFGTVMTNLVNIITGNSILFTMFAGGLLAVGAKIFRKIRHAVA